MQLPVCDEVSVKPGSGVVLLVDDEELVRMAVADGLRDAGYTVFEAASAANALERIRQGLTPDILVTDHMMPGMTGAALAREIRSRIPGLPVLMITGYANLRSDETRGLDVLAKPFRQRDLAMRVAEVIETRPHGNIRQLPRRLD
jgi:CheY-like chemotaxis protein